MSKKQKNSSEPSWEKELEKLSKWAKQKGFKVQFSKKEASHAIIETKTITLSKNHTPEIKVYILLHEIGHLLVEANKSKKKSLYNPVNEIFSNNSSTRKILIVQEELEAWCEGFFLSKKLKIKINRKKFEECKTRSVSTYLRWATGTGA